MKWLSSLERLVRLTFTRQTSPSVDTDTTVMYFDAIGRPRVKIDNAGVETEYQVPLSSVVGTFTGEGGSFSLIVPTSGTVVTRDGTEILTNKDIDGATAANNRRITIPKDTKANLDTLTRKEGTIVYASDEDRMYVDNGTSLVGLDTDTNIKNYIANPSARYNTDNWTRVSMSAVRYAASGIPRLSTTKTGFRLVSIDTAATCTSSAVLLDSADLGRKLAIELAFNVEDAGNWTIDLMNSATEGGTYTRIPLSTDSAGATFLPATIGVFKSSADMDSSKPWIKFKITSLVDGKLAHFSDIIVTPDSSTVTGAVVGGWFPLTFSAPTNLGTGTATTTATHYRSGSTMVLKLQCVKDANAGTGANGVTWAMPTGYTIDLSALPSRYVLGTGTFNGSNYGARTEVRAANSTTFVMTKAGAAAFLGSDFTANGDVEMDLLIPIAEWAGSGTVNVAGNDVEYVSNSNSTNTASDTTSFAYGPAGSNIPNGAVGTAYIRTVSFSNIQASDRIIVETDVGTGSTKWMDAASNLPYDGANTVAYGLYISSVSGNTVVVTFGSGGISSLAAATYGANGTAWSVITGWKWRVRKVSASSVAGFALADSVSAGLMGTGTQTIAGAKTFTDEFKVYKSSGSAKVILGSGDGTGAALLLDGNANGDAIGADYASITHTTDGVLEIKNLNTTAIKLLSNSGTGLELGTGNFYSTFIRDTTTGSSSNVYIDPTTGQLFRSTSSLKYKTDIISYTRGLSEVLSMTPVFYKSLVGEKQFAGFIAEDMHSLGLTEFVDYTQNGEPDAIHYGSITTILVKAIQDQQAIIAALESRIAALEGTS